MQLGSDEKKNYFQVVLTSSSGAKNQPTQVSPSILHLSKKRSNLRAYGHYDPMWGTNGSVLTPGTRRDGRKNPEPVLSGFRTGFPVPAVLHYCGSPWALIDVVGVPTDRA